MTSPSSTTASTPRSAWSRLHGVLRAHPWISDGLIWALPVAVISVNSIMARVLVNTTGIAPRWLDATIALLITLPLALRRLSPLTSSVLIAVGCTMAVFVGTGPSTAVIAVPLTVFSTAVWGSRRDSRIVLGLGLVGSLAIGVWAYMLALQNAMGPGGRPVDQSEYIALIALIALCAAIVLSAWLWGILLEKERESESRLAADAERMRIAREMHDIIAHSLSVVIAQADGGRYAAKSNPEAAEAALTTIARTGRDALTQTRSLLGVLRTDGLADQPTAPLPGIDSIPSLVSDVRATGLAVSLDGFDSGRSAERLSEGAGLAVYRIVQEALTNVLKHAGSGARAQVILRDTDREVIVRVTDDGVSAPRDPDSAEGTGSGLTGMRERAALYGGSVTAGQNRREPGFTVTARFPATTPLDHSEPAPATPDGQTRASADEPASAPDALQADPDTAPVESIEDGAR
jgi:signal transduction histidine kinase